MRISDWSSDVCSSDLPITADLVGVSLSTAAGKACYIPLGHTVGKPADGGLDLDGATEAPKQIPRDDALAILKPMLEDPGALKVGQNIKYEMLVFARYGIAVAPIDDNMRLSYLAERSGERRRGKEWVSTCRSRWDPYH